MNNYKNFLFKARIEIISILVGIVAGISISLLLKVLIGDEKINKTVLLLIFLIVNYTISIYKIKTHLFYDDSLLIKYPTRFIKRYKNIEYSNIYECKYEISAKQLRFYIKYKIYKKRYITSFQPFWNKKKFDLLISFLDTKKIKIIISNYGELVEYIK